jgi:crotonobetainyl-CoA:carnitine CoA-transferase CaiB-like acyl-CoA transferase
VGAFKANPLRDICAALELPDLSLEARFASLEQQFVHKAELQGRFRERFLIRPRDHWLGRLEAEDLLCAPVRDMREVLVDPQTVHNAMVMEGPAAGGTRYRFIASPIGMSAAPVTLTRVPPRLGEHTDEVLAEAAASAAKGRP